MEREAFSIIPRSYLASRDLSPMAKLVLLGLRSHYNRTTGQCNPKRATLAKELGLSESAIKRGLSRLRQAGWITSQKGQRGSSYSFLPGQKRPAESNPAGSKAPGTPGQKRPADAPYPYMNQNLGNHKGSCETPGVYVTLCSNGAKPDSPGSLFLPFFELFVKAGVPLNSRDRKLAETAFSKIPQAEHQAIIDWVRHMLATQWKTPEFTPLPINALRSKGWERIAALRTVPRKPTQMELSRAAVHEFFRRRGQT